MKPKRPLALTTDDHATFGRSCSCATGGGGWLTGRQIEETVRRRLITIEPFSVDLLNPNSYNYRLGPTIQRLISPEIDLLREERFEMLHIDAEGLVLLPGECYLGHTIEVFGSRLYASLVTGRSSVGR